MIVFRSAYWGFALGDSFRIDIRFDGDLISSEGRDVGFRGARRGYVR